MSFITDFIEFNKVRKAGKKYAKMLNGYTPIFSQFGQNIYASDVVQQAVSCIVTEMKKLTPQHIIQNGGSDTPVYDDIQKLLEHPNPIMTQADFIEKVFWQLFLNYNSFIIPTFETVTDENGKKRKRYTGLYPIQPIEVSFFQNEKDELFVNFKFSNSYESLLRYSDVIHLKYRYSVNEFMGGNANGQPDNEALLKTLQLNHTLLEGIAKALKASFAINGVVKYKSLIGGEIVEADIKELEQKLKANESGFLPLDISGDFIPITRDTKFVDETTLRFLDEKILRNFGVSLPILTGDYSKEQYEAFFQKTLEPLIKSISQEFTKVLFSDRQKSFGHKIVFYPHELVFMNTTQKLEMVRLLGDSGALYENEKRAAFGLKPLKELEGVRKMSLNYVDVKDASLYQVGKDDSQQNEE